MSNPLSIPPRTQPLSREEHTRRVDALTQLLNSPGWAHVAERLRRRQEEIVQKVMSSATPAAEVPELRKLHAEIDTILAIPAQDREISQRAIDGAALSSR